MAAQAYLSETFIAVDMESETKAAEGGERSQHLLDSIRNQDISLLLTLLQNGVDVETKDENGIRGLSIAAGQGHSQVVQTLLQFNAKIHIQGEKREAPLVAAAFQGHLAVVKIFKDCGIDEWDRRQALLDAIRNGHLSIVEELFIVPKDLNYEQSDDSGINYLAVAADNGHLQIVSFILSKGASQLSLKKRWTSPLHKAAAKGYINVARLLVENGADLLALNGRGFTPLLVACFNNEPEIATYLASKMDAYDLDIREDNHCAALHWAIFKINAPLVHKLLERGANPDGVPGDIYWPLHMAINMGLCEVSIDLLDHEADIKTRDQRGLTSLHLAAASSNCQPLLKRLIDEGLEVNDQSPEGFTPLYWAVQADNTAAVEILLSHQADPNKATRLGLTPLHEAAGKGNDKVVELLLNEGADLEAVAFDKTKPIHLAAANWKTSVVQKFLSNYQTLSDIDGYGMTVWNYALNHEPTLNALGIRKNPTNSSDGSIIENIRSESLAKMVILYREFCGQAKSPVAEHKLIVGMTNILLLKREISMLHQLYKTWVPLYKIHHGYELQFTCFKCQSRELSSGLYRCTQCLHICICTNCYQRHTTSSEVQNCNGHEIISLTGEESSQPLDIADLEVGGNELLERSGTHGQQISNLQSNLPRRAAKNEPELIIPKLTSPIIPPVLDSEDSFQAEGLKEIGTAINQFIQAYTTNKDKTVLIQATNSIKSALPFISLGMPEYRDFRYKLILVTLWRYQIPQTEAYSVDDLDSILTVIDEAISLYIQTEQEWIPCCLAFIWFCHRRISMDNSTVTCVERYIIIVETFWHIAASHDLLKEDSATYVVTHELLADLHSLEYDRTGSPKHLDDAIIFKRSAIFQDLPLAQEDRKPYYVLGMLLCSRYEKTFLKADIIECIEMLTVYCGLVPGSNVLRAIGLNNLAFAMKLRWNNTGAREKNDLEKALKIVQEAYQIAEQANLTHLLGEMMTNIGNIRSSLYEASGAIHELDLAIEASRESLEEADISNDIKAVRMNNLAYRLKMMYERTNNFSNIEEGIRVTKQALSFRNVERHSTCMLLNTMVGLLVQKYRRDGGSQDDWDRVVRISKVAVGSEPSLQSRVLYMHSLSAVLTERYDMFNVERDLTAAIEYGLRCLRYSSVSHSDRSLFLTGLGSRFGKQHNRSNKIVDLNCALGLHEAAVQLNPFHEIAVNNLGAATMDRWFATNDKDDLRLTIDRMEARYQNISFSNFGRVRGAAAAGLFAMELGDYNRASALLKGAISLLPDLSLPLIDRKDLQHVLSQLTGLPERIASAYLLNSDHSVVDALDLMESARGIIASLAINARSNEKTGPGSLVQADIDVTNDAKTFMKLAEYGPIVTFVVSQFKSSAIIVTSQDIKSIDLPSLRYKDLKDEAIKYLVGEEVMTRGSKGTRFERVQRFKILLRWLWGVAVKPVLQSLGFITDNFWHAILPRIWWISSGLMGVMPLHAAGDHARGSRENTMSYVVSSYAPTLKMLRYSRQRLIDIEITKDPSVMVVAMPKTENRKPLKVETEITTIETTFSRTFVLRNPTEEKTLDGMRTCNIGHFICHGHSDYQDPSKSGLVLSSGIFTLEKLSQQYFPNAHIMYLSSCSTAETSTENLVDEVLHLGSGFQLVGFAHVIGTLWEVEDEESAIVSRNFYSTIKEKRGAYLEEGVIARALHDAVKRQRDAQSDDPIAWAAQVHFGL